MEWREQTMVRCEVAFSEAQRWVEEVTKKKFGSSNFRSALENGVLLCDLLNKLKPGIIKRVNRLSTPIAGLDNVNVFLKACGKLGLNDAQLFHPGDLQDVSTRVTVRRQETSRRLKNVLITIYWLGRKAQADPSYHGPQLNFKAFEGLLGIALSKALEEASCSKLSVRDIGFGETWYPDQAVPNYKREDSVESQDSVESHPLSVTTDNTLITGSEGFGSDAEAEHCFRMTEPPSAPDRDRRNVPAVLKKKRFQQHEGGRGHISQLQSENGRGLVSPCLDLPPVSAFHQWARDYQSDSESDSDRPEPDLVQDDLASRRFRSTTPATPANFAVPLSPRSIRPFPALTPSVRKSKATMSASWLATVPHEGSSQSDTPLLSGSTEGKPSSLEKELLLQAWNEDSSDSDEGRGYADPIQDDLYARRVLQTTHQTSVNMDSDKFLPKYWTPEEDAHVGKIRLGSQRRPWYKIMQGFRSKSMNDIPSKPVAQESFHPLKSCPSKATTVSLRQEQMWHHQAKLRENEAKWQEDLSRWKTRRRSVNSDLHRKKEEREQLGLLTSGIVQVEEKPEQEQSFCRSSLQKEEPNLASIATNKAFAPSPLASSDCNMPAPINSTGPVCVRRGGSYDNSTSETSPHTPPVVSTASDCVQSSSSPSLPGLAPAPVQRAKSLESAFSGTPQMSAALPRGFRRSEATSRLSAGVTPKPFSTSRRSTQPRFYSMGDSSYNGQREQDQLPAPVPHQGIDTTPDDKDDAHLRSTRAVTQWRKEEGVKGKRMDSAPSIHSFMSASVLMPDKAVSASREDKVDHCDMRVSLNQTPNSGTDFGFQAHWDSTGTCIISVQPGSSAQLCHLQAGDEIVALGGQRVAEMSYEQWKANMDAALREGKLLMDIRRLSLNGHADHHTSISTTSSLPMESKTKAQVNGHPVNGLPLKATNRSILDSPVPTKNKGGSESAISDLQVPSIGASSSRWCWNTEEERRRQEKWQMEQEHLLQEKYRRDQERLEEAWRRDQQEAALEEISSPENRDVAPLPSGNIVHYTPAPFLHRSNSSSLVAPTRQAQEVALLQNKQVQIAAGHPTKEEHDSSKTSQWPRESYGFTKLTAPDRKKSISTPSLDGSRKQDSRVGVKKDRPSRAEQERLQILEEMRKKTPVLTDSSWIRQRSTCTIHKEPINVTPLRRHESLDSVHTISGSSSKQFSSSSQPLSSLSSITPYRGYSGRCSLGPGAAIFSNALRQSSWSPSPMSPVSDAEEAHNHSQQPDRLVSRRRQCSYCEQLLAKGPAMVIESLDLSFHIGCFKCVSCKTRLRTHPESGAQVRVRHRQLFCNTCYNRVQASTSIPK